MCATITATVRHNELGSQVSKLDSVEVVTTET